MDFTFVISDKIDRHVMHAVKSSALISHKGNLKAELTKILLRLHMFTMCSMMAFKERHHVRAEIFTKLSQKLVMMKIINIKYKCFKTITERMNFVNIILCHKSTHYWLPVVLAAVNIWSIYSVIYMAHTNNNLLLHAGTL